MDFPGFARHHLGIDFPFPQDFERLPLGIVIDARELDQVRVSRSWRSDHTLNEI